MSAKILVTFSTKYGSTQGVAESIADVLKEKYYSVDLCQSRDIKNLDEYQAVIIGTAMYAGQMLSDTRKFITRFEEQLKTLPSVLFILGPLSNAAQEVRGVQVQYEANRKKFPWYSPVSTQIFAGALDLKKLRFPDSLIKLYRSTPENPMRSHDGRDWKAIRTWALSLPKLLNLKQD